MDDAESSEPGLGTAGGPGSPRVTVVCVPRDHYSDAERGLEALIDHTDVPHELVYVLGRAPRDVGRHLRARAAEIGFTLIERDEHLVPNHARNLALARVRTEFVAFVDNDAIVTAGWLGPLLECADDTGASLVGPLQLIGPLEDEAIHLAGGWIELGDTKRPRSIRSIHRYQRLTVGEVPEPLHREACDFAEFHCMLARTQSLDRVGPLDEALLSVREVEDLAMAVAADGGTAWFEPASRVTFLPPKSLRWAELGFVARRWGERANRQSFRYFYAKHDLDASHITAIGFSNAQRRPIFAPVRRTVARLRVRTLERGVAYLLYQLDRALNHAFVRPGRTSY